MSPPYSPEPTSTREYFGLQCTMAALRTYLQLGRVSNLPTVWSNVVAGSLLSGASPLAPLAGLSLSLFYVAGMFLNDAWDAEIDARERPERPIPSGKITRREVFTVGGVLLLVAVVSLVAASPTPLAATLSGLCLAGFILIYNRHHKGNTHAPWLMGSCRALVYICAATAGGGSLQPALLAGAFSLLLYVSSLTYVARFESGQRLTAYWPLLFLSAPLLLGVCAVGPAGLSWPFALSFCSVLVCAVIAVRPLLGQAQKNIGDSVGLLIATIALVDGFLILAFAPSPYFWIAPAAWLATLGLQRLVPGT